MNPLLWMVTAWMLAAPGAVHFDGATIRAAGKVHGVPDEVMEGVAAVETGYSGRNDVLGKAGEIGRFQIEVPTARAAGCPEPVAKRLWEHGYNVACAARILRQLYEREHSWSRAVMAYNSPAYPEAAAAYLRLVEKEIGQMRLAAIDAAPPVP